jgi:hypothetical protein
MSTQIKTRRGTTAEHSTFTGSEAEITVDTTLDSLVVHDGVTAGGHPMAKMSDIVAGGSADKLPLAGGALTGDVTTTGTFDGRDVSVDGTKLDTIETGATADQTKVDIDALGIAATSLTGSQATAISDNTAKATNVSTNLAYTTGASTGIVTSSDGTDATLPAATTSLAGLLTGADKTLLDGLTIGSTVQAYDATIVVDADIGTSVQAFDADTAKTDVTQTYTASQRGAVTALTDQLDIATDLALSNNYSVTLAGNRTLVNPTNCTAGQSGSIFITQDATGSRTLAYGSYFKFVGGTAPVLTTTANSICRIDYAVKSATEIHAVASLDVK